MEKIFVKNYKSQLNVIETQKAIKLIKYKFEKYLSSYLGLSRVSAPLFVDSSTGLNDHLSGKEKPISFSLLDKTELEIVQSLAKWKRSALKKYNLTGLYTDMNAIRPNEELDNLHSLYVDQWDWEKVISKKERTLDYLKMTVNKIYKAIVATCRLVTKSYPTLKFNLPKDVYFISSEELLKKYPKLSAKEREKTITRKHGCVFITQIGYKLSDGSIHDVRAADYDDWNLNGDLLVWYPLLNVPLELSSMGIRVNKESLMRQLKEKNELFKLKYSYHKDIINNKLPLTIGGGIGQSRLCMFMLNKAHIGETQSSYWPQKDIEKFKKYNIELL